MTTLPEHERLEARLDLAATIFIELIASDSHESGSVVMCHSLDFSATGLQVVVDEDVSPGSILRLCIDLKDAEPIFLVGEVKWQRLDDETDANRLGFQLFESEDTDIERWKEIVAQKLTSAP